MGYRFLVGGARAGKSAVAEKLALASGRGVTFVATAVAEDEEMSERIVRHQGSRPRLWNVVEEPLELERAIVDVSRDDFVVLDCLTLWVSNMMFAGHADHEVVATAQGVAGVLGSRPAGVAVSNEVGSGIVPTAAVARRFRDLLGRVNASFAAASDQAFLVVSGRVIELDELDA